MAETAAKIWMNLRILSVQFAKNFGMVIPIYCDLLVCVENLIPNAQTTPVIGGNFTGSAEDFVAAGDSVLVRIKHHMNEGMHLFVSWSPIAVLCFFLRFCFRIFILSILKECCLIVTLCIYYLHSESYRYVDVWMQSFQVTPVS